MIGSPTFTPSLSMAMNGPPDHQPIIDASSRQPGRFTRARRVAPLVISPLAFGAGLDPNQIRELRPCLDAMRGESFRRTIELEKLDFHMFVKQP